MLVPNEADCFPSKHAHEVTYVNDGSIGIHPMAFIEYYLC
jgi:hypothetical protein